jgi:hypothetical protein
LFLFRRTSTGWKRKKLVGGQTVDVVERFITRGIEADEAEAGPETDAEEAEPPREDRSQPPTTSAIFWAGFIFPQGDFIGKYR